MQRRQFLQQIAGAAAIQAVPATQPNVGIILTDDQGIGDVGC